MHRHAWRGFKDFPRFLPEGTALVQVLELLGRSDRVLELVHHRAADLVPERGERWLETAKARSRSKT